MKLSVACLAASVLLAAAPSMAQVVAPPDPDPLPPPREGRIVPPGNVRFTNAVPATPPKSGNR